MLLPCFDSIDFCVVKQRKIRSLVDSNDIDYRVPRHSVHVYDSTLCTFTKKKNVGKKNGKIMQKSTISFTHYNDLLFKSWAYEYFKYNDRWYTQTMRTLYAMTQR